MSVALKLVVYEKQQILGIIMKMHEFGNVPYWMISYIYFLVVFSIYMLILCDIWCTFIGKNASQLKNFLFLFFL